MPALVSDLPVSSLRRASGRIVSGLAAVFLLFDAVIKLLRLGPVEESFARLGVPVELAVAIGTLELVCLGLYLSPRTSVVGAVLLTGFLGGATATHVRIGDPLLTHVLFPSYVGILIWGGLLLGDRRLLAVVSRVDLAEARSTSE